jgi:hypothetical protein
MRRLLDTIFAFEGLGFLTRVSKNNFMFSGLKGMVARIVEWYLGHTEREYCDEIKVDGKRYIIRSSVQLGGFY